MSKVQFNLLPDSKLTFNRQQRTKKLVYTTATLICVVSVALLLIMLGVVDGLQKKMLNDAAKKVDTASSQLQTLNINKIITVQNQLQALPALHQSKHITSRIFGYLPKITPTNVSLNRLDLDLTKNTMSISGTADSQITVNSYIDTLKYAVFNVPNVNSQKDCSGAQGTWNKDSQQCTKPAFQQVVESGFSLSASSVGYTIDMQFAPELFSNSARDSQGKVITPTISVTNPTSSLRDPASSLFNGQSSGGSR